MSQTVEVIEPLGRLDISNAAQLRRQVTDIAATKPTLLLVDLSNVSFMDSSGLGALVSALKTMRGVGADMALCGANDQVTMLFDLTSMSKIFKIYKSRTDFSEKTGLSK
jgi:anti-anti-sigma factor